jgi:hypothetical protein
LILFNPKDEAKIGETEYFSASFSLLSTKTPPFLDFKSDPEFEIPGLVGVRGWLTVSLPLKNESFFFTPSLTWVCLQVELLEEAVLAGVVGVESLDLAGFFLSDRIGEFDPIDLGLLLDPSGLEVSDFFEDEKNSLFLNTILF